MRILVVDDHMLIRVGLRHTLAELGDPALEILEAASCADALALAARHRDIDLVLLDLNLPDAAGLAGLDQFAREHPDLPVLALSSIDDQATIRAVLQRGAAGYIPKTCLNDILLPALRLVIAGGVYVPPEALQRTAEPPAVRAEEPEVLRRRLEAKAQHLGLSGRQAEVLALLAQGRSNKEIARSLNLAATTVKAHVGLVLRALNVHTRSQAILALLNGDGGGG